MCAQKMSCFDAAIKLLSKRDYSVKEMAGKLKEKSYEGHTIAETIDRLEGKGWLDDEKFALNKTRYRAEISKWGAQRIRQELMQKGIASSLIDKALAEIKEPADPSYDQPHDFQESATQLLERRFGLLEQTESPTEFE